MARKTKRKASDKIAVDKAAELLGMTKAGVYLMIKRGELLKGLSGGRFVVSRRAVMEARRLRIEFYRPKPKVMTDEEFMRRMWESDPD